jgi:four helix bundle protein
MEVMEERKRSFLEGEKDGGVGTKFPRGWGIKTVTDEFTFPLEKLEVWHLAIDLADFVLKILEPFLKDKYYRLIGQMEAAVSSVAQNIAEGKGRQYKKEFIQYLYIAEGSLFELLTLVEVFKRRGVINEQEANEIRKRAEILDRKLHGLINSLRSRL